MKARSYNTRFVEALEARSMFATVVSADLNHDNLDDKVEVTNSTTITVSLAQAGGGFAVSAVLRAPKNQPFVGVSVYDYDGDGQLDIQGGGNTNGGRWYSHVFQGNGNGTFGDRTTTTGRFPKNWI